MITLIAAHTPSHVIGLNNDLPRHYPEDFQHFKDKTRNKTIIMGRKTYEAIGRPLPNRRNIVLTQNPNRSAPGVEVIHSIDTALKRSQEGQDLRIIGGGYIYGQFLAHANAMELTHIHKEYPGDAFFPSYNLSERTEVSRDSHTDYDFIRYERKT